MEDRNTGLWEGGGWERTGPQVDLPPPVEVHEGHPSALRPRPRRLRRRWPWYAWLFIALFLVGVIGTVLQGGDFLHILPGQSQEEFEEDWPGFSGDDPERSDKPPTIRRAATGTGVTVTLENDDRTPLTFAQIYDKNLPSMVSLECYGPTSAATGTGVILTEDGYIITNAHVVAEASEVRVLLYNNRMLEARLVGFDADEDLAVLKVEAQGLTPAEFGDSDLLRSGDPVAALGDPLGYRATITNGIVSALDREIDMHGTSMVLIQTSAAINFGNSGGALINQYGQVVGITTIKIVADDGSAEAIGFAIPSRRVKYVADILIDGGKVKPGMFGITVSTYTTEEGGLEVMAVKPGSDAAKQGIRKGDVILTAEGIPVTSPQVLSRCKLERGAGDPVTLVCSRDGEPYTVVVELMG